MHETVVGVDPGKSTGLCAVQGGVIVAACVAQSYAEVQQFLSTWCHEGATVVVEDFVLGARPASAKDPIKMIGVVEFICEREGLHLVMSSPSILQRMLPRVRGAHPSPHVRSAYAHVLHYVGRSR